MYSQPPNIVFILSDQHAANKLGCYGHSEVHTPHIDNLAAEGCLFENAYCNSPLRVPSRLSFLTGMYAWKIGAWNLLSQPPQDRVSLQSLLSDHGYHTVAIGKMHFVGEEQLWGFDERPYGDFLGGSHQPDPIDLAPKLTFQPAGPAEIPEDAMQEHIVTQLAIDFLNNAPSDKSFFLIASYNKPHFPLRPPARYWEQYPPDDLTLPDLGADFPQRLHPWIQRHREFHGVTDWTERQTRIALAGYYGCVSYVDEQVGKLMCALEASGRRDNTLVIYTSDHGEMCGEHGLWGKSCFYEASARVPLIFSYPNRLRPGTRIPNIVELVDLFPTLADFANINITQVLDGESLCPLLFGNVGERHKHHAISELYGHSAVGPMRMLRRDHWKYVQYIGAKPSLFNLEDDPNECVDRIDDPAAAAIAKTYDAFLRSDWDEAKVLENFRFSPDRETMQSPRKHYVPSQYRTQAGQYIDAESFYPDVYPGQ